MKKLLCKQNFLSFLLLRIIAFVFIGLSMYHLSYADDQISDVSTGNVEKKEKIHITADKLVSDSEVNFFEFIGNVKATQGDTVITADRLKVFYTKDMNNEKNELAGKQSIQKIIARGNVTIQFDDKVAKTQQATYTTETRILVLSGPDSKIIRGKDSISGEKITFYRTDERIKVESGSENRVEAVFFSGGKGIN